MDISYREGQELEFKLEWNLKALEDIAAFANTRGGKLYVGVDDAGKAVGCEAADEQIQRITNQISDRLGIGVWVAPAVMGGVEILEIAVQQAPHLVALGGRYYGRVGSTNRQLSPDELGQRSLRLVGKTWDAMPSEATPADLSEESVRRFAELAHDRYPQLDGDADLLAILDNLHLLRDGRVANAAVLMFGEHAERFTPTAQYQIGRLFRDSDDIVDLRIRSGNLLRLVEHIDDDWTHFLSRRVVITAEGRGVKGAQRQEVWEYPRKALREAMLNALVHRDYTVPGHIQIKVFSDQLEIWNPGGLAPGLDLKQLRITPHPSRPRNELLARLCHYAGLIEQFGTGTTRMIAACSEQGLPEPRFEEKAGGFHVLFVQDRYQPERLKEQGLQDEQIEILAAAREAGGISNEHVQTLLGVAKRTATRRLKELVEAGYLVREGTTGRGTLYRLA